MLGWLIEMLNNRIQEFYGEELPFKFVVNSKSLLEIHIVKNTITPYYATEVGKDIKENLKNDAYKWLNNINDKHCSTKSVNYYYSMGSDIHHTVHDSWHTADKKNTTIPHQHLFRPRFAPITPDDMTCLTDKLKATHRYFDLCTDGKTNCILTDDQVAELKKEYSKYYAEQNSPPHPATKILQSFAYAYCNVMLHHYFKPWLITKTGQPKAAFLATFVLDGFMSTLAGIKLSHIFLALILKPVIQATLEATHLTELTKFAAMIESAIACAQNPLSLLDSSLNLLPAAGGTQLAYKTIRCLPKLKMPGIDDSPNNTKPNPNTLFNNNTTHLNRSRSTLRKRH